MAATYCGKDCTECVHKEPMNCAGCKTGPGRTYGGDCELAKCVRAKGHETCSSCTLKGQCGNLRTCQYFPEYRRRKQEAEKQARETQERRAPLFGKWLWILFWLVIPTSIAAMISDDTVGQLFPGLYVAGQILRILCEVTYGLILLKLGTEENSYRKAGIFTLIYGGMFALLTVVSALTTSQWWILLISIPAAIMELIGEYHEYSAHGAILADWDKELSDKWAVLWKWFVGLYLATFGCIFVALLSPVLGIFSLLGAVVGLIVVAVLKLIYLYRTAKLFREYASVDFS